ncbi:MAG: PhoH family protein [Bacteroidales bacterium]|nr:PhoH family protein [Bacteroidales bacterium]
MEEYLGYKEIIPTDDELNTVFQPNGDNLFGCLQNEYLVAKDEDGNVLELLKCVNGKMVKVPFKTITGRFLGKVKPRNIHQQLAIDLLYDTETTVKVITGKFGTGKDFLMCAAAVDLLEHSKYEKIVYVRNNIEVKNSKPIGFLPGNYNEKMMPFAMPMADHLGGVDGLSLMIGHGQIEIVHLGFIRGRDIKNSIIICSEAENMTKEHIQLLLGRVGEGSALWINGDFKQCDGEIFQKNSGLLAAVDRLKGHPRFGYVKLQKTERSETAAMADLLD